MIRVSLFLRLRGLLSVCVLVCLWYVCLWVECPRAPTRPLMKHGSHSPHDESVRMGCPALLMGELGMMSPRGFAPTSALSGRNLLLLVVLFDDSCHSS